MDTEQTNPGFSETVRGDLRRHTNKFNWFLVLAYCRRPSFFAVFLYRLSSVCVSKGIIGKAAAIIFARLNLMMHACEIAPEAVIGPGLVLPHTPGIVVGMATIGSDATILHNTTIGRRKIDVTDGSDRTEYPVLGDNVIVSPGAVILGSITIGNRAQIGANAVVLENVPDDSIAVGIPARNIARAKAA